MAALGYVEAITDIPGKFPTDVEKGAADIENPAVNAVMPQKAVLHFKRFMTGKGALPDANAVVKVIDMNTLGPSVAVLIFHTSAGEFEPAVVEPVAHSGSVGTPDQCRCTFQDVQIVISRFLQSRFGSNPFLNF